MFGKRFAQDHTSSFFADNQGGRLMATVWKQIRSASLILRLRPDNTEAPSEHPGGRSLRDRILRFLTIIAAVGAFLLLSARSIFSQELAQYQQSPAPLSASSSAESVSHLRPLLTTSCECIVAHDSFARRNKRLGSVPLPLQPDGTHPPAQLPNILTSIYKHQKSAVTTLNSRGILRHYPYYSLAATYNYNAPAPSGQAKSQQTSGAEEKHHSSRHGPPENSV